MNRSPQSAASETRSETIFRHTRAMLHETRCSIEAFSQRVVEAYHARVSADARDVIFKTEGDVFRCAATNAQKLNRYMLADVNARLPVDLEEAWVLGLSLPYRDRCLHDLAGRYGFLPVRSPIAAGSLDASALARLTRDFGEALVSIGPMLADGCISSDERPAVSAAVRELEEVIADATELISAFKATGAGGA